ncbi:MAG: monooxygenase [Halioglobus sp.]|nr:monooxygenase [Halioglobus sp.]|tara:strand:+ start:79 stop:1542 length:1464 start_codon:yes stop_codon:yes gene_type:complete
MAEKQLKVVVLGAGMAGILAGIKLQEAGFTDVTLYEKADRVGGTWRENTYPGLTCDVPSHHYTYTFERNPDWTRHLPPGPEVQAYFERVSRKYGVDKLTRFNEEAVSANYQDGRWQLAFRSGLRDSADILICATGVLHQPQTPDIEGLHDFAGALFHSARWDHSVPLDGKRIGVIGNGSTGVQLVSALAGRAAHLEHYTRTPQWIMPVENGHFTEAQRAAFRDPQVLAEAMDFEGYNAAVNAYTEAIIDEHSEGAKNMAAACLQNLEQSVADPQLREKLRPTHRALCKRLIFSPDYYQAIQHPNAALVTEGVERIEARGIRTADGQLHELDIIVLATGFRPDVFMRPMRISGRNGADLEALWADHPKAYLAITMPDFPNLFMLNGPNGPVGNYSLIDIAEHQWHYIEQLIARLRSGQASEICCHAQALERFEHERTEAAKKTVWFTGGCNSWYLDSRGVPASWPWTYARFLEEMAAPRWEDLDCVAG